MSIYLEGKHPIVLSKTLARCQVGPSVDNIQLVLHGTDIAAFRIEAANLNRQHTWRCVWDTNDLSTTTATEVVVVELSRISQVWVGSGYTLGELECLARNNQIHAEGASGALLAWRTMADGLDARIHYIAPNPVQL